MNNELKKNLEQIQDGLTYVHDYKELLIDLIYNVTTSIEKNLEMGNETVQIIELIECFEEVRKEK